MWDNSKLFFVAEAIEAICKYSDSVPSILKRKIITKEILFAYLHQNDIPISLPAVKNALIERICAFWNITNDDSLHHDYKQIEQPTTSAESNTVELLAFKFGEWFYSMMNNHSYVESKHFWPDAKFKLNMVSHKTVTAEYIEDTPERISEMLFKIKTEYNLHFNPNFSGGINAHIDPHGLVIMLVCGTLHKNSVLVGIFEQTFSLARDPFSENNWKIKKSELNLKDGSSVSGKPEAIEVSEQQYLTE